KYRHAVMAVVPENLASERRADAQAVKLDKGISATALLLEELRQIPRAFGSHALDLGQSFGLSFRHAENVVAESLDQTLGGLLPDAQDLAGGDVADEALLIVGDLRHDQVRLELQAKAAVVVPDSACFDLVAFIGPTGHANDGDHAARGSPDLQDGKTCFQGAE